MQIGNKSNKSLHGVIDYHLYSNDKRIEDARKNSQGYQGKGLRYFFHNGLFLGQKKNIVSIHYKEKGVLESAIVVSMVKCK